MIERWTPHVVVATLVQQDSRFLFVEEDIGERTVLNQPAGHWEAGETLAEAAVRETLEETAWHVEPYGFLGIYCHHAVPAGIDFLRMAFLARPLRREPNRALDEGIRRALWLSLDELLASPVAHRSPLVERCVRDALAGRCFPLDLVAPPS